jgi:hypothetical protein
VQQPTWTNADERCSGHVEPDLRASGGNRCVEPNFSDMPLPCSEAVLSCRSRGDDVAYAQHVDSTMRCCPHDMAKERREGAAWASFGSRLSHLIVPCRSSPRVCCGLNRTA